MKVFLERAMQHLRSLIGSEHPKKRLPIEQLLDAFRSDPGQFLRQYGAASYEWPPTPFDLPDMYLIHQGVAFGYVHRMALQEPSTIIVRHFAIGEGRSERAGLGTTLAHWLRDELKSRYHISAILFAETSYREHDPLFFNKLGATYVGTVDYCQQYLWCI